MIQIKIPNPKPVIVIIVLIWATKIADVVKNTNNIFLKILFKFPYFIEVIFKDSFC